MDRERLYPVLRRVNCLFHGIFGQLTTKSVMHPLPIALTSAWSEHETCSSWKSVSAGLPKLCSKCSGGKNFSKLADAFPQKSSARCVWFRYNNAEKRGEVCIPTILDPDFFAGEIYRCQLCGDLMTYSSTIGNTAKIGMKRIFQDLVQEMDRLFYFKPRPPRIPVPLSSVRISLPEVNVTLPRPHGDFRFSTTSPPRISVVPVYPPRFKTNSNYK